MALREAEEAMQRQSTRSRPPHVWWGFHWFWPPEQRVVARAANPIVLISDSGGAASVIAFHLGKMRADEEPAEYRDWLGERTGGAEPTREQAAPLLGGARFGTIGEAAGGRRCDGPRVARYALHAASGRRRCARSPTRFGRRMRP